MKPIRVLSILFGLIAYVGCSDVGFKSTPSGTCSGVRATFGNGACIENPDGTNTYEYTVRVGEVDILVVDDNSNSMYTEQSQMANRFPGFLDSIKALNYQIAIITTDISASPGNPPATPNQNGALQDGKFISFPNGKKILSNPNDSQLVHQQNILDFQNTIKRPETLACNTSVAGSCPSSDERGIYALNMALDRGEQNFFRAGGHLAVVILSDENERSFGGNNSSYPLEDYDKPETFVEKTKEQLHPTKTVSVHSIIIKPNDTSCLNAQNAQTGVKGFYGHLYAALSNPTQALMDAGNIVPGALGSICSNNYTNELGNIALQIQDQTLGTIQLLCKPLDNTVHVTFDPAPSQQITFDVDDHNRLTLNPLAQPGTKVRLTYNCSKTE